MTNLQQDITGMVYTMTNALANNEIIAYRRQEDGRLTFLTTYSTMGMGTGKQEVDPLTSQGSIILSADSRFLFAVNAKSNDISSFAVSESGELTFLDVTPSGGVFPNSLALSGSLLYVSNSGDSNIGSSSNITGFMSSQGHLSIIEGSSSSLSTSSSHPACIVFSPSGNELIVSELSTNKLGIYLVMRDGSLMPPHIYNSNGKGPFGSTCLSNGILLVTEAGSNALSSYLLMDQGKLGLLSGSVPNNQTATCWVTTSLNEKFAYTSNAGSNSITLYNILPGGMLAAVENNVSSQRSTAAPTDSGVSRDGKNLYVLNGNQGSISVFQIQENGKLIETEEFRDTNLPQQGAQGLAVI